MRNKFIDKICQNLQEQADMVMLIAFSVKQEDTRDIFVEIAMDIDMTIKKLQENKNKTEQV